MQVTTLDLERFVTANLLYEDQHDVSQLAVSLAREPSMRERESPSTTN